MSAVAATQLVNFRARRPRTQQRLHALIDTANMQRRLWGGTVVAEQRLNTIPLYYWEELLDEEEASRTRH